MAGRVTFTGGEPSIVGVSAETALAVPAEFVAVTSMRSRLPMSAASTV